MLAGNLGLLMLIQLCISVTAVEKCISCVYVDGSSNDVSIKSDLDTLDLVLDSDSECVNPGEDPSVFLTTSCGGNFKCFHGVVSFTLKSEQGNSAEVKTTFRECMAPSELHKDYDDVTCYENIKKNKMDEKLLNALSLDVADYQGTACFCDDHDNCNAASISSLRQEYGSRNRATKSGGVASFFAIFLILGLLTC